MVDIQSQNTWEQNKQLIEEIAKEAKTLSATPGLTRRAELALLNVTQFYLIHKHQYKECLGLSAIWLKKTQQEHSSEKYPVDHYLFTLSNYLMCAFKCEKLSLLPTGINEIKMIKPESDARAADCFRLAAQYELLYMLNTKKFEHADVTVKDILSGLKKYKALISERQLVFFRFNIVLVYFVQTKYDEALAHIAQLHHLSGRDERYVMIISTVRVMEWMCQAATGNYEVLDNQLRSLKKYFKDRGFVNELTREMFALFSQIQKEAGLKPASRVSIKKSIAQLDVAPEWAQLQSIICEWL